MSLTTHFISIGALLGLILLFMIVVTINILRNSKRLKEKESLSPFAVRAASRMCIATCMHFKDLRNSQSDNDFDRGWDNGFDMVIAYQARLIADMLDKYGELDYKDKILAEVAAARDLREDHEEGDELEDDD